MGRENKEYKVVGKRQNGNEGWKETHIVNG